MALTTPQYPNLAAVDGTGSNWTNPNSVLSDDANYAQTLLSDASPDSRNLVATSFGFTIPADAEVIQVRALFRVRRTTARGINVRASLRSSLGNGVERGITAVGTAFQSHSFSPQDPGSWGLSLTPSVINAPSFGIALRGFITGSHALSPEFHCQWVTLEIGYTTFSTTFVKDGGIWKQTRAYYKQSATWKPATEYVNDGGIWKI